MRNNISKNEKASNALTKQINGNKKKKTLRRTLNAFFDAGSFNGYESSLASLLQTFILNEATDTLQLANMTHQVRLITNLLLELSRYQDQKDLLSSLKELKGGESC
jgi:hypothetical protein